MRNKPWLCVFFFLLSTVFGRPEEQKPSLFRQPTLSHTQIVFSYAGDLWIVSREGGDARRLTSGTGIDRDPVFSPDGSQVAFTRESGYNYDVHIVPTAGGETRRLTYRGGETVGWTRDGKQVMFTYFSIIAQLLSVPSIGGTAMALPLPAAMYGSFSQDGKRIAYLPFWSRYYGWKSYRGGATSRIWIADLPDCRIEKIPRDNSNDFNPMWVDDRIYFLSDRNGLISLFAYSVATKTVSEIIKNPESDILSASAGPGGIVYERFGSLHVYDFKTGRSSRLEIRVSGEMPDRQPRSVNALDNLTRMRLSPVGDRVLIEARGELLTMRVGSSSEVQNLTNSSGVFERFPAWSPDGRSIAYFSDESGEYALHICNVDGTGSVKKIGLGTMPGFYFTPTWSPDSKKVAYRDHRLSLWYLDIEKASPVHIDTDCYPQRLWGRIEAPPPSWSPDSLWLSYTRMLRNHLRALCIYSLETGRSHQVTDGMSDVSSPQFDRSGKFLFFGASTDEGPTLGRELSSWFRRSTRRIYVAFLRKNVKSLTDADGEASGSVTIDFEGLSDRLAVLPVPEHNYTKLVAGKQGVLLLLETDQSQSGIPGMDPSSAPQTLYRSELATRKTDKLIESIRDFDLSFDGERMLYKRGQKWAVSPADVAPKSDEGALELESLHVHVDPGAQWKQMFREVRRAVRDSFYDPGYHGLDWEACGKRFEPYLEGVASAADLNYLFREMLSELRVSHVGAGARPVPQTEMAATSFLGADYATADGRYRIARVFAGDRWNPQVQAPLAQPGMDISQGDFLLAVDGRELRASDNIDSFLLDKAGKELVLRIAADAAGTQSRDVKIVPVYEEWGLRSFAWAEHNRRKVDELSGGRVAYIHLPDTGTDGLAAFDRYFFAQSDREAMIIDARDNSGGAMADYFITRLSQRILALGTAREGSDATVPYGAVRGPKVMITNEGAYSGGDSLAYFFRQAGLGPLVGTRTAGGVMGPFALNLIDGGWVSVPYFGAYNPEGKWLAENEGIAPDIEVEQDPATVRAGRDPQLEKAIEVVMDLLKKNPRRAIKKPPYRRFQ